MVVVEGELEANQLGTKFAEVEKRNIFELIFIPRNKNAGIINAANSTKVFDQSEKSASINHQIFEAPNKFVKKILLVFNRKKVTVVDTKMKRWK